MIKHAIVEGLKNVVRSFWLSATAISVLTVSLASVALVASMSTVVGFTLRQLDNQVAIVAYFKDSTDADTVKSVREDIAKMPEVKEVKYVNRDQANTELQNSKGIAKSLLQTLQSNNEQLVLEYLSITPKSSESYSVINSALKGERYQGVFDEVHGSEEFISFLQKLYYWTNIIGLIFIFVFALVSILVMVNILRIAIYSRREEIEIMRLVGATNNYIRGPFIAEGTYFNLIAAAIVLVLFVPTVNILIPNLERWLNIQVDTSSSTLVFQMYLSLALTMLFGIIVGVGTAYSATRRYLKL